MYQLTDAEYDSLRSQFATLNTGRGRHRKYLPFAFTEHGAIMAATVLHSDRAIEVSLFVVRAFVRMREVLASNQHLAARLDALEQKAELLAFRHDTFSANTRAQLKQVFEALRALMTPPVKRPIGFVVPDEPSRKK